MTIFYLVRHALHDWLGQGIAGRTDVPLSDAGHAQAGRLAERLSREPIDAVQTSPLLRTRQTAQPIAERLGLGAELAPAVVEIDFGEWTGRRFGELEADPRWRRWNAVRSTSRAPEGETMIEVQARFVDHLSRLSRERPGGRVALVSHGDPIRAVLAHWLGMPLDLFLRLEVSPASISVIGLDDGGPRVFSINEAIPG
ncbi:MAG TPA: histidine phosphatase family protein [Arenibaculum sp.]|nr:histidine phosphatase family protein [Arenibaculum sp.]